MPPIAASSDRRGARLLDAVFAIGAIAFVALAVAGATRTWSPVPHWDMWDGYLGFYTKLADGDAGAWWAQHNEHRMVLGRLLFWIDLAHFRGRGVFLIVANYLLVAAACALFVRMAWERTHGSMRWLAGFLVAWLFLWIQENNLTWGFQSAFFLAQLLPLCGFWSMHHAARGKPGAFGWALAFGVLSIGTMANGVLALPLMSVQALLCGLGRRRIVILALASLACTALYFNGYVAPAGHGSLTRSLLESPGMVLRFTLLYLGGPFAHLAGGAASGIGVGLVAGASMLVVCAGATWRALRQRPPDTLRIALLAFMVYVGGTAFGTAGGRAAFGIEQALSSRYMTPALMAWAALLLIALPAGGPRRRAPRATLAIACALLLVPMAPLQWAALQRHDAVQFERSVGTLALAMGVRDARTIGQTFPFIDQALSIARVPRERHWSIFATPPWRDAASTIGAPSGTTVRGDVACRGGIDEAESIGDDSRYLRITGWLHDTTHDRVPHSAQVVDARGVVRGLLLTGHFRPDVAAALTPAATRAGFVGFVLAEDEGADLRLVDPEGGCALRTTVPRLVYRIRPGSESAAASVGAERVVSQGEWLGTDESDSRPAGMKVIGSWVRGHGDTGAARLSLAPGDRLLYRSGPSAGRQYVEVVGQPGSRRTLPRAIDWVVLEVASTGPGGPRSELRFVDAGDGWGEWSAVAVNAD
ncbi:MAG: hypothetical protein EHM87_20665 [Burkholderiales bacterium]|nr:MAG: hypothetical protein EHM87_20665 [Burkholderiales bacterium]